VSIGKLQSASRHVATIARDVRKTVGGRAHDWCIGQMKSLRCCENRFPHIYDYMRSPTANRLVNRWIWIVTVIIFCIFFSAAILWERERERERERKRERERERLHCGGSFGNIPVQLWNEGWLNIKFSPAALCAVSTSASDLDWFAFSECPRVIFHEPFCNEGHAKCIAEETFQHKFRTSEHKLDIFGAIICSRFMQI